MDAAALQSAMANAATCSFWSAQLTFTQPITARHYCLLGNNQYAAPTVFGDCQYDNDAACDVCLSWDGTQKRTCDYWKGVLVESASSNNDDDDGTATTRSIHNKATRPPSAGYDDITCPVGYEQYTNVLDLTIGCPVDSVLMLEVLPTWSYDATTIALAQELNMPLPQEAAAAEYDFVLDAPHKAQVVWEAHQCLTGTGGRSCGQDPLVMLAFHKDGHCNTTFASGTGYQVQCETDDNNGIISSSPWKSRQPDCHVQNGLSCRQVMMQSVGLTTANNPPDSNSIDVIEGDGLCGLNEIETLGEPLAWLAGIAAMLLTLIPSFHHYWQQNRGKNDRANNNNESDMSPQFLMGLLSEALKNGFVVGSIMSVDWSCLSQYGIMGSNDDDTSSNHSIYLPYALLAFSCADTILVMIAVCFRYSEQSVSQEENEDTTPSKAFPETFDKLKWSGSGTNMYHRVATFLTIAVLGGLGAFMQLVLVLEGIVDSPEEGAEGDTALQTWASWVFIVSASMGGFVGMLLMMVSVYTGNMRLAWKVFKFMVGDIPGIVSAIDLAVVLSPGWLAETMNDVLQVVLYIPSFISTTKEG